MLSKSLYSVQEVSEICENNHKLLEEGKIFKSTSLEYCTVSIHDVACLAYKGRLRTLAWREGYLYRVGGRTTAAPLYRRLIFSRG